MAYSCIRDHECAAYRSRLAVSMLSLTPAPDLTSSPDPSIGKFGSAKKSWVSLLPANYTRVVFTKSLV